MKVVTGKLWMSLRSRVLPDSWWMALWIVLFAAWGIWLALGGYWFNGAAMVLLAYAIWLCR